MKQYRVIGLMSGTSLDGLDMAYCTFYKKVHHWNFDFHIGETVAYSSDWKARLKGAMDISGYDLSMLHVELGQLHGEWVKEFISKNNIDAVDAICSHGHTIFHNPQQSLTLQIGSAPHIAAATGFPVVADFRTKDVALGGQGAPLVPIGDALLFSEYQACLNLGGIANVSFDSNGSRVAGDISICNILLNAIAARVNRDYDKGGEIARAGNVIEALLEKWNAISFYENPLPKSLGREFFETNYALDLEPNEHSVEDLMRTATEHIAIQISNALSKYEINTTFVTGGGAFNEFLVERIRQLSGVEIQIPSTEIIQFKEAIVFGFLGVLRLSGDVNTLRSVTGAAQDSIGGAIWL
jgi:anhydro-N-acetylmuramic acid kinase